jgi:hypothetical protein
LIRRLLASLLLVAGLFPVAAAPVLAVNSGCLDNALLGKHYFAGMYHDAGTTWVDAVAADINPLMSTFGLCSFNAGDDDVTSWVAISPGATNDHYGNPSAILQVGIVHCNRSGKAYCAPGSIKYFWAKGGCGTALPTPVYLGSGNDITHRWKIERKSIGGAWYYRLSVDGDPRVDLSIYDSAIGCWAAAEDTRAVVSVESTDGGNGYADASNKLNVQDVKYRVANGAWTNTSWNPANGCNIPATNSATLDHKCDVTGAAQFTVWSEWK